MTDPKDIEVANLAQKTPDDDLSFLNAEDDPLDRLPEPPVEPVAEAPVQPSTPPPASVPAAPAAPVHPVDLVEAARSFGIDERHITGMSTDALFAVVLRLNKAETQGQRPSAEPTKPVAAAAEEDDDESLIDQIEREIEPDPRLVKLLRKQTKTIKNLQGAGKKLEEIERREQNRTVLAGIEAVDAAFDQLGPKFEKLFGKGDVNTLKDEAAKAKRIDIYKAAGIDFQKDSPRAIQKKIISVAQNLYGDLLADPVAPAKATEAPKAPSEAPKGKYTTEEAARAALGRPAGARSKRERAAEDAVQSYMVEHGIFNGSGGKDEFEGVPE